MIQVRAPDGSIVQFPEDTPDSTIERVMRSEYGGPETTTPTAPEDVRDERGVPGGTPSPARQRASFGEQMIDTSAGVLGAPVDRMNDILEAVGVPVSSAPVMGSEFIGSALHGLSGARERREIGEREGVMPGGAPLGERVYSSFLNTPQAQEKFLTRTYGPENDGWYRLADRFGKSTGRYVVRNEDGTENLFNPPGIDAGDIAGLAGSVPDLVGAIAGGAASVPAYALGPWVGIPTTAATSAVGAQLVGEPVGRLFPENRDAEPSVLSDVLPRAAGEAGMDALLGGTMGGAARIMRSVSNRVRAPFSESASDPMAAEFRQAADRLNRQGYDISPLPSEEGAGGFIPRVEGFLEKLPGSSEKMRQYRQSGDQAIARFQRDIGGGTDPNQVGREVVSELQTQRQNLAIDREGALSRADELIGGNEAALTARQGPLMGAESAGRQTRAGLERARQEFRDEARQLYDAARNAPGGSDPIVDMGPVRQQAARIRDQLPPTAQQERLRATGLLDASGSPMQRSTIEGGDPVSQFTPQGLTRFLSGVDDIADTITIDQARQMRSLIMDAIDDKTLLPGVPERHLSQLQHSISRAIEGSVERAATPELRDALAAANRHYAQNIDRFSRRGIAETYREPTSPGYVEDNQLVQRLLSGRGAPGVVRETRDLMGGDSPEWAATRRNAIEQILDTGRDQTRQGRRLVNVDGLVARLNTLDDEAVRELFGVADADQLRRLAVDVSNRAKYVEAGALSPSGSPDILNQLRAAAVAEDQIAREYRNSVIGPFLRGDGGAAARMKPEELVPWLYRRASPEEAAAVMSKLEPAMRTRVEQGVVADIIESAISQGRGDISAVRRLVTGEANPADSQGIAEILGAGRDSVSRQQADRVNALVSPENRQALQDLALITARRQERDATTQAIGGLAAGAAVTNILTRPSRALQAGVVARGLAELITRPGVRRWLTSTRRTQMAPIDEAQSIALSPPLARLLAGGVSERADVQAAIDWLNEGVSQVDEAGQRMTNAPPGYNSWEEFFEGQGGR